MGNISLLSCAVICILHCVDEEQAMSDTFTPLLILHLLNKQITSLCLCLHPLMNKFLRPITPFSMHQRQQNGAQYIWEFKTLVVVSNNLLWRKGKSKITATLNVQELSSSLQAASVHFLVTIWHSSTLWEVETLYLWRATQFLSY